MPVLNIKDAEAYRLAHRIAEITGKSLTRVVIDALRAEDERIGPPLPDLSQARKILAEINRLPIRDGRSGEEILAEFYDEHGLIK